ncbi:alpha/beta hydrolase fold domain-containing protein [Streptomyces sp. ISL-98]|uniref:alpha/beta hydrolase fold domain-containing protein n=1 Tax=Streptomyces sp. ISL-98 TaxID=2819192 RepID=UPI0020355635|nr:alpha/beta hydrolase fold domain-containing protein [Streptomyces sp. ISL-98]
MATAELCPNRDEDISYALRLPAAGVSVELHQWPGTFHTGRRRSCQPRGCSGRSPNSAPPCGALWPRETVSELAPS